MNWVGPFLISVAVSSYAHNTNRFLLIWLSQADLNAGYYSSLYIHWCMNGPFFRFTIFQDYHSTCMETFAKLCSSFWNLFVSLEAVAYCISVTGMKWKFSNCVDRQPSFLQLSRRYCQSKLLVVLVFLSFCTIFCMLSFTVLRWCWAFL